MNVNQWGAVNQWSASVEPLIINAALGLSSTQALSASVTINGESVTINAALSQSITSALPASVTITPAPSVPILIDAQPSASYSQGFRANVTIGAITINIHPSTHYEIPNYY